MHLTDAQAQGGLIKSLKLVLRSKQIPWLVISHGFIMWGMTVTMYYESTLTYGYAWQFLNQGMDIEAARTAATGFVTLATIVPGMLVGLIMMMFKVRETNGADTVTVTGTE